MEFCSTPGACALLLALYCSPLHARRPRHAGKGRSGVPCSVTKSVGLYIRCELTGTTKTDGFLLNFHRKSFNLHRKPHSVDTVVREQARLFGRADVAQGLLEEEHGLLVVPAVGHLPRIHPDGMDLSLCTFYDGFSVLMQACLGTFKF